MSKFGNIKSDGSTLLVNLFDIQLRTVVTTRMLPAIYLLALILAGLMALYSVVWAFDKGWITGVFWLLIGGPALFIALITSVRVLLEFVLTVFRIAVMMESLGGQVDSMAGQIDELSEDLPRIQFWKPRRTKD